ncbi:cerebellin-1-like [Osmerus mordax]|uniref:cerebellin-1-like n=1 Tax=Osmerus mordax TaxID=8014 RepID=UPI00350FF8BA
MQAAVSHLLLLGVLCLNFRVQASTLREAAGELEGVLPCGSWDCECAFTRQRGCCCASGQFHKLEELVFQRMTDLWSGLSRLNDHVQQATEGMGVAFSSSRAPGNQCYGPFNRNMPIPYSVISLNNGNGYNPALGVFTAPHAGLYSFSFTAYSKEPSANDRLYYQVQLMRNGEVMASTWEDNREDSEDSATQTVLLALERGGQVYVDLLPGRQLCGDATGRNRFSGYMLYPAEARG